MDKLEDLIAAHPKLFRGLPPAVPGHIPPGWHALVDELCSAIELLMAPEPERIEVTEIKEKFGSLRFYCSVEGAADMFIDLHTEEGLKTLVQKADGPAVMENVRTLVMEAYRRSVRTCQECGAPGLRAVRGGWVSTLCERHVTERGAQ